MKYTRHLAHAIHDRILERPTAARGWHQGCPQGDPLPSGSSVADRGKQRSLTTQPRSLLAGSRIASRSLPANGPQQFDAVCSIPGNSLKQSTVAPFSKVEWEEIPVFGLMRPKVGVTDVQKPRRPCALRKLGCRSERQQRSQNNPALYLAGLVQRASRSLTANASQQFDAA